MARDYEYDFFISHAGEDKTRLARPLASCLRRAGFSVWFDEQQIKAGDSLARSIEHGLLKSRFAILLATLNFFDEKKYWTYSERDALMALEAASESRIIPVLHGIGFSIFRRLAPLLAGRLVLNTFNGLGEVVAKLAPHFPQKQLVLDPNVSKQGFYPFWSGEAIVNSKKKRRIEVAAELLRYGDEVFAYWNARSMVDGARAEDAYAVDGRISNNEFLALYGEHTNPTALNQGYILLRRARSAERMDGQFIAVSRNSEEIVGGKIVLHRVELRDD